MSDDFKRKLEAYERGELSDKELEEFERELDRLEQYQEYLEEGQNDETKPLLQSEKKQQKVLKRSKWKARLQTAFNAFLLIIGFTILSSFLTAGYFAWGKPDRSEVLSKVIDYTLTITNPYGYLGGTSLNVKPFFTMEASRDLKKTVGHETMIVGEMKVNFLFSKMSFPEENYYGRISQMQPSFSYPGSIEESSTDWNRLEKLPEGTVVSAYLSFSELFQTDKVFELFEGKNMDIIWFGVNTGVEKENEIISEPIGFPNFPIWHEDDMILESREEKKGLFGSGVVSESHSSPVYEEGDVEMLHNQFMKTLHFLKGHEKKANNLYFWKLELDKRMAYFEKNGFKHYGVVITGPTKEVLKLKEEPWVSGLVVDEVSFWNWNE